MKKVVASAPGKVILMGEHAVVYGKPALIAAINKRLTVSISESKNLEIHSEEGKEYIEHILKKVCEHFHENISSVTIEIDSDIPIGYHLGSSAALAAALVGALSFYLKKIWNPALINQLAYESEKFIHVNASGVDPAAVVSGGLIWYRKELDFLRSIWQLPFAIPEQLHHFYLYDTGRPYESTGDMVTFVKNQHTLQEFLEKNEKETRRIAVAIKEGNEKELLSAITTGERTLEDIGVVSGKAKEIIRKIEKNGGAAKILGGGGRADGVGYLLVFDPNKKGELVLGAEGIRLEQKE